MGRNARLYAGGIACKTVSFGFLYVKHGNVRSQFTHDLLKVYLQLNNTCKFQLYITTILYLS